MKSVFVEVKTPLLSSMIFSYRCIVSGKIPNTGIFGSSLTLSQLIGEYLRWLITVASTFQEVEFDGSLLPLFTIMVSKNCPITGEHVDVIFVTQ